LPFLHFATAAKVLPVHLIPAVLPSSNTTARERGRGGGGAVRRGHKAGAGQGQPVYHQGCSCGCKRGGVIAPGLRSPRSPTIGESCWCSTTSRQGIGSAARAPPRKLSAGLLGP
jgi:hypothetical protein